MGVGSFFQKLAPWLAAGVQFVPGAGPVIAGTITKIAGDHGVSLPSAVAPTVESIGDAVAALTGNSAAMVALKQQDQSYAEQMQAIGFKQITDLEALADADAADARKRETAVRDHTPEIGFYLLITAFVLVIAALFKFPVPTENKAMIYLMVGSLGTLVVGAAQYFYGTTRSSGAKDQVLADIAKQP